MIWHILTGAALHFSEQLKVPLKYEPQDLHWSNLQVIVHSGILDDSGMKEYHAVECHFIDNSKMKVLHENSHAPVYLFISDKIQPIYYKHTQLCSTVPLLYTVFYMYETQKRTLFDCL